MTRRPGHRARIQTTVPLAGGATRAALAAGDEIDYQYADSGIVKIAGSPATLSYAGKTGGPWSIWDSTATPAVPANNDPSSVELGVRFRSEKAGYILAIRFYKGASNVGPHTGKLWTTAGVLLASVPFSGETASGWQEARFATPVAITANTVYVASYYTASGYYSVTRPAFASAVYHAPLTALANGDGGGNGLYQYGTGGFPTLTANPATNYWVDIVFDVVSTPPSGTTTTLTLAGGTMAARAPVSYVLAINREQLAVKAHGHHGHG